MLPQFCAMNLSNLFMGDMFSIHYMPENTEISFHWCLATQDD